MDKMNSSLEKKILDAAAKKIQDQYKKEKNRLVRYNVVDKNSKIEQDDDMIIISNKAEYPIPAWMDIGELSESLQKELKGIIKRA